MEIWKSIDRKERERERERYIKFMREITGKQHVGVKQSEHILHSVVCLLSQHESPINATQTPPNGATPEGSISMASWWRLNARDGVNHRPVWKRPGGTPLWKRCVWPAHRLMDRAVSAGWDQILYINNCINTSRTVGTEPDTFNRKQVKITWPMYCQVNPAGSLFHQPIFS